MCGTAQNDDKILPLDKTAKIAFIGEFATSHVIRVVEALT